jgi:hypothetical protein
MLPVLPVETVTGAFEVICLMGTTLAALWSMMFAARG